MPSAKVTLGLVQLRSHRTLHDPAWGRPRELGENWRPTVQGVEQAARQGAQIVVLPELMLQPYFCQTTEAAGYLREASTIPGPLTEELSSLARRLGIVLVGGTLLERGDDGRVYNTATLFDVDGRLLGCYRKSRLPMDEGFHEQLYFAPGTDGPGVFATSFGTLGILVCYDQWFPELARSAALAGAELLVYPSAIGDIDGLRFRDECSWQRMWLNAHLGHAAVNNVFVAAVNRVGHEGRIAFWGGSFVLDPSSRIITQGGCAQDIVLAECDLARVRETQDAWGFLRTHRQATAAG